MYRVAGIALAGLLLAGCTTSVATREHYMGSGALAGIGTGAVIGAAQGATVGGFWGAGIGAVAGATVGYAMLPETQGVCYLNNRKTGQREAHYCYF
jgi:uncharacterized membrane protein